MSDNERAVLVRFAKALRKYFEEGDPRDLIQSCREIEDYFSGLLP